MRRRIEGPLLVRAVRMPALWSLRRVASVVLRRHRPLIVGITGSVGKTTTKDLIAEAIERRHRTWATPESVSGELGAALTVLGVQLTRRRWLEWLSGFARGAWLVVAPRRCYPDIVVVEMAAGRPGELRRITRAIRPDIAIVTAVRRTHMEHFRTLDAVAAEKSWLVRRLRPGGTAVLNADDERVAAMAGLCRGRVVRLGRGAEADLRMETLEAGPRGLAADVRIGDRRVRLESPLLGARRADSLLAALAVGDLLDVPRAEVLEMIRRFHGPPGRLRAVRGNGGLTILDDTYNASPDAVEHALEVLRSCGPPRRAVLGEMAELGRAEMDLHREIGQHAGRSLDYLVAVGAGGLHIAAAAVEEGMEPCRVRWAKDAAGAAALLDGISGGTLLVTGSHHLGLERAFRPLLLDPGDPGALDRTGHVPPTRRPVAGAP